MKAMETKQRRETFYAWIEENKYRIRYARKGYLDNILDAYNNEHSDNIIKNKEELWRWLYSFRRRNGVGIRYCPTKKRIIRSRSKHSNYIEEK